MASEWNLHARVCVSVDMFLMGNGSVGRISKFVVADIHVRVLKKYTPAGEIALEGIGTCVRGCLHGALLEGRLCRS